MIHGIISLMKEGTKNPHTPEWNRKISESVKKQHAEGRGSKKGFSKEAQYKGVLARLGKPLSNEHKEKLRNAKLGKKHSLEQRRKNSESHKGLRHMGYLRGAASPNWKGGITKEVQRIRNSPPMRAWVRTVLIRDDFTCTFCKVRGIKLHVDHIKRFADYPELRLVLENGRTLCVPCHRQITWPKKKT